jgi:hypothetical protein
MIARTWRGITRESDQDTYFEYRQRTGLKEYASIPGNQGVWGGSANARLSSPGLAGNLADAIEAFPSPDHERVVYYPEDKKFRLEMLPRVEHHEVLHSPLR